MGAQPVTSSAHAHLNVLTELLRRHPPAKALARFAKHLESNKLDVVSANAVRFVTHELSIEDVVSAALSRAQRAKLQIAVCGKQLAEIARQKMRNKVVLAHPLDLVSASVLGNARHVRFLRAHPNALNVLRRAEAHHPLTAPRALEKADLVLLEPRAITVKDAVVAQGGRLLAELAKAHGLPVYAVATSWHASAGWRTAEDEERIPHAYLTGIISEHGIYKPTQFLARVKKTFPWLL